MSILRNGHVPCHYCFNLHVDFKMVSWNMSISRDTLYRVVVVFLVSLGSMSHVHFKKRSCRHVPFNGQEPTLWPIPETLEETLFNNNKDRVFLKKNVIST